MPSKKKIRSIQSIQRNLFSEVISPSDRLSPFIIEGEKNSFKVTGKFRGLLFQMKGIILRYSKRICAHLTILLLATRRLKFVSMPQSNLPSQKQKKENKKKKIVSVSMRLTS